jgi:hypothetical protein
MFNKFFPEKNEVFDLNYEDVVDEKLLLSTKNPKIKKICVNFDSKNVKIHNISHHMEHLFLQNFLQN